MNLFSLVSSVIALPGALYTWIREEIVFPDTEKPLPPIRVYGDAKDIYLE